MAKNKGRKSKKPASPQTEKEKPRPHRLLYGALVGLATVLGGVVAALTLLPRITVTPSDPVDVKNPFSASFTIANTGIIPLDDVGVTVFPLEVSAAPRNFDENHRPPVDAPNIQGVSFPQWEHHKLPLDERFTVTPLHIFGVPEGAQFSGADIAVVVHYEPWFLPWKRQRQFRFVTRRQASGAFLWYSQPMQ